MTQTITPTRRPAQSQPLRKRTYTAEAEAICAAHEFAWLSLPEKRHRHYGGAMHLTSSSAVTSPRSSPAKALRSQATQRLPGGSPIVDASSLGRIGSRLLHLRQRLRAGWTTLETFLVDYYRACGITATPTEPTRMRRLHLCPRELLTLVEPQRSHRLEVIRGEIWLTQTPASKDLLLGPGARLDLNDAFPIVIEALEVTEIVLRSKG